MRIAGVIRDSLVNGEGVRDVIFTQGCAHHCPNCHNPDTWKPNGGILVSADEVWELLKDSPNNVTFSGGDPIYQYLSLLEVLMRIKINSNKNVWLYTGYTYEELPRVMWETLYLYGVSVVIDGKFEEQLKDSTLLYRGSSNQRIIDLGKTLSENQVVLWGV